MKTTDWQTYRLSYTESAQKILDTLALDEKIFLMSGSESKKGVRGAIQDKTNTHYNEKPYRAGGIEEKNIPPMLFADGTRGVVCGREKYTCFPVTSMRGASFHPELERQMTAAIAAARRRPEIVTVWEVPLLFELGWESVFDAVAVVWTEPALRRLRLQARGLTDEEILRREARQWPAERKLEQADYALINNGSAIYLQMQCMELLNNLNRKV